MINEPKSFTLIGTTPGHVRTERELRFEERIRIGDALQEGLAQELAGAYLVLSSMMANIPADRDKLMNDLNAIKSIVHRGIRTCCTLAEEIAP